MDENDVKKFLGQKIKLYRKKTKMTQEVFSERIGITQRQISLIELGKSFPTPKTLLNISRVFDCSIGDLFDFNETSEKNKNTRKKLSNLIEKLPDNKIKILYLIADNFN